MAPPKAFEWKLPPVGEKILPASQGPTHFPCELCGSSFTTKRGKTTHMVSCKKKHRENSREKEEASSMHTTSTQKVMPLQQNQKVTSQTTHHQVKVWGDHPEKDINQIISAAYEEIVHWKPNMFLVPSGASGKEFVKETTRLINAWNSNNKYLKRISLKAVMIMPYLLLQKPCYKSSAKQNADCLKRRIALWTQGDFDSLLREARTIQSTLKKLTTKSNEESRSKRFAKFILAGNVKAALRELDENSSKGVLNLTNSTLEELLEKHPKGAEPDESVLLTGEMPLFDPVIFESINESKIAASAIKTKGAAGPSGMNADGWRRILISRSFGRTGTELRKSIAEMTKILCMTKLNNEDQSLEAYTSCRLIPLDKDPGVRPIGIGEVLRRIIGKTVINTIKPDILSSAGSLQLCAGLPAGSEAAVHSMREIFDEEATDALLLVDAQNAFNSLNRKVLLHNIHYVCPPMGNYVNNCYRYPSRLFISGSNQEIPSSEGTTQGDPLAMPSYAIGVVPLLPLIVNNSNTKQAAFADDFCGGGSLVDLRKWWARIEESGPLFGYFPNASKSWLIVKEDKLEEAMELFAGTNIKITSDGRRYLGGFIGKKEGLQSYQQELVKNWISEIETLSDFAKTEPQAVYSCFTHGWVHKLNYFLRVIPDFSDELKLLDETIDLKLLPVMLGKNFISENERELLSLSPKLGGLGIPIFSKTCLQEFENSRRLTNQSINNIREQRQEFDVDLEQLKKAKATIHNENRKRKESTLEQLKQAMTRDQRRSAELASLKAASSWLTFIPSKTENTVLNKREFHDAIALRYRWPHKYLPTNCACGKAFNVDHALSCPKGGYIYARHDGVRDLIGEIAREISNDVEIEPHLQELTGEQLGNTRSNESKEARLDLSVRGFWQRGERAFFDVRIFNPFAPTHVNKDLNSVFRSNEKEKKRSYGRRVVEVEHGSFTPLVFTPYGGYGFETTKAIAVLINKLSEKRDFDRSLIGQWVNAKVSFELLRSAILCIRGSRNRKTTLANEIDNVELIMEKNKNTYL